MRKRPRRAICTMARRGFSLALLESLGQKFFDDAEKTYGKALDKQFSRMKIGEAGSHKWH